MNDKNATFNSPITRFGGEIAGKTPGKMVDFLFFIVLFLVVVGIVMLLLGNGKEGDDSKALFWANIAEPLIYRTQDISDDGVMLRVENAKRNLREHGNKYLLPTDVHAFIWGADQDNPTLDFQRWADLVDKRAIMIREDYRKEKANRNKLAAAELLGGQRMPEFDDIQEQ